MLIDHARRHPGRVGSIAAAVGAVVVIALLALSSLATADRAGAGKPSLSLVSRHPLTVRGSGFKPHKRVRVTLNAGQSTTRHPVAGGRGGFTVTFGATTLDRCSSWSVSASQRHQHAVVLRGPKPECAPL